MADYHVSAGVFGRVYAGTLMPKKDGRPQMWRAKSDVTEEAIAAVRDHMVGDCLDEKNGKFQGGYEWTRKDGKKVLLLVKVVDGGAEDKDHLHS